MLWLNKFKRFGGWRTEEGKKHRNYSERKCHFFLSFCFSFYCFVYQIRVRIMIFVSDRQGSMCYKLCRASRLTKKPYNSSNEMDIFEINWHHFPFFSSSSFCMCVCVFAFWIRFHVNFHLLFTQCAVDGPLFRVSSLEIFFSFFFSFSSV